MTNSIDDSPHLLPPFDSDDQGDTPMILYPHLRDLECRIAGRIVAWVNAHPEMPYYREYILMLTPDVLFSKFMDDLAFGIYRHTDASTWLSWHDVPGSSSLLWRYAILRAAQHLHA
jgi:hypothetical protein